MNSLLLRIVCATSCCAPLAAQAASTDIETRARAVEAELAKFGFEFATPTKLEALSPGDFTAACEARVAELLPSKWIDAQHYLRQALGAEAGNSVAALKVQLARKWFGHGVGFYRPTSKSFVFDASRVADAQDLELQLARELSCAAHDARSSIDGVLGKGAATTEALSIGWMLLAGEAQVAALAVRETRAGRDIGAVDATALGDPLTAQPLDAFTRFVHTIGRDTQLARLQHSGWKGVRASFAEAPVSSEQMLHASKLFRDTPKQVVLPQWNAELGLEAVVFEDTLGELALHALLLDAGLEPAVARVASIGWEGDRLQLLRAKTGELALVWRVLFDRPDDVKQFASALGGKSLGQIVGRGYCVDFVRSDLAALVPKLIVALNGVKPAPTPNEEDQKSTAEAEAVTQPALVMTPRVENGLWLHPALELALPVPEQWTAETHDEQPYLFAPQIDKFRDNIAVVELPRESEATIATLLERHLAGIKKRAAWTIDAAETRAVSGREVVYLRYHGKMEKHERYTTVLIYLLDARPIVVTATAATGTWEVRRAQIDAMFNGLRIGRPTK